MPSKKRERTARWVALLGTIVSAATWYSISARIGGENGPVQPVSRRGSERIQEKLERTRPHQSLIARKLGQVFVIEDFNSKATREQLGVNYFGGNTGAVESTPGFADLRIVPRGAEDWWLRLEYDFRKQQGDGNFAGVFFTLLGPAQGKIELDGTGKEPESSTRFRDHFVDTADFFRGFRPWQGRKIDELRVDIEVEGDSPLTIRFELQSDNGINKPRERAFKRLTIQPGKCRPIRLAIPGDFAAERAGFDWSRLSIFSILVEKQHQADRIVNVNPSRGRLLIDNLQLVDSKGAYPDFDAMRGKPEYDRAFLEQVRALTFMYFIDFVGTDPRSGGIIQDRSTRADELSLAGAGFQLTAYVIGVENGYLQRDEAAGRTAHILEALGNGPHGPERVGKVGYRGFFYRSLSIDGRRKLFFHRKGEAQNDLLSTIEVSTVDTALFLCGALTAAQFFDSNNEIESAIRKLANDIYARVEWPFMHDKQTDQMMLGWTPNENRRDDLPGTTRFRLPDAHGLGHYSSKFVNGVEAPATFDYYTDEGMLIALLACAAPKPEYRLSASVFFSMIRAGKPFVKTYPGSLFTYQFASCWLNTASLGHDRDPWKQSRAIDYFENSREAIRATMRYASDNPLKRKSFGPARWGLSACQGPFGDYFAEAAPSAALAKESACIDKKGRWHALPLEHGTLTPYGAGCSLLHWPKESIAALWECERLGMLHPRFGFADAFNLDIADAVTDCVNKEDAAILRTNGSWRNQTGFAIDQGPFLVILDNHLRHRAVPRLFASHPQIRDTLARLFPHWKAEVD